MHSTAETLGAGPGSAAAPEIAAAALQLAADRLVAFPTETVWGLGALAQSERAVAGLRRFKGRDQGQPISILVADGGELAVLGFDLSPLALRLMDAFWPGPMTLVMPCTGSFASGVARAEDGAVGVRCSSHPIARGLARAVASAGLGPLTATSLNLRAEAPVKSRSDALRLCGRAIAGPAGSSGPAGPRGFNGPAGPPGSAEPIVVLPDGGIETGASRPSTVVDLCGSQPRILRAGAVDRASVEEVVGPVLVARPALEGSSPQ